MRNLMLSICFIVSLIQIHAQGIHFLQEDVVLGQSEACAAFYSVSGVINNTGTERTIVWERLENNMPCDWQNSVCDINLCYAPNIDTNSFVLADGDTMYLSINFYPQFQEAEGSVLMRAYVQDDPDIADTLNFVGLSTSCAGSSPCVSSIADISTFGGKVFPNPFHSIVTISEISAFANVSIFDISGKQVIPSLVLTNNRLDLSGLQPGIYVLLINEGVNWFRKIIIKE